MLWLAALFSTLSIGLLVYELAGRHWKPDHLRTDGLTRALRRLGETALMQNLPWLKRYQLHLAPYFQEIPLPASLDICLFVALQPLCGILAALMVTSALPRAGIWLTPPAIAVGFALPYTWLRHERQVFHQALLRTLPDCLEQLALILEAGLDLTAGLQQFVNHASGGPLRNLLLATLREIQMGRSRAAAISALGKRTSFAPLTEICRGIVQGLIQGTSLASLLRRQAAALRSKRMQIAEKKAAEAPLKILFPLFVFIFPTIFLVLLGPVALSLSGMGF